MHFLGGIRTDPMSNFLFITNSELVAVVFKDPKLLAEINAFFKK